MLVKEFELYKSVYCGLCKQLGKNYGMVAKLVLSYDCTFLAMVYSGIKGNSQTFKITKGRCCCNPLKKCSYCSYIDDSLNFSAAFSVISFHYKLIDTIKDEDFFKSLAARIMLLFSSGWRKKAIKNYKNIDDLVKVMLENQFAVEEYKNCSVDRAAHPTAHMISELMKTFAENERERAVFAQFGYFLGRWIYIIDATDDFDKDITANSFNPIRNKFDGIECSLNDEQVKEYCNGLLNQTMANLISAYNLMDIGKFKSIIEHIINVGMPEIQRKVIFDRKVNNKQFKN